MLKKYIIGVVVIALFISFVPIQMLVVKTEDKLKYLLRIEDGDIFSIRWVHSVEEEEWEEFFTPKKESIYLDSTRFKTFGAGVPSQAGTSSYLKDGWVYMDGINRFIGDLTIQAGYNTNHRLIVSEHVYILSQLNKDKVYTFSVENYPLYKYLYLLFLKS